MGCTECSWAGHIRLSKEPRGDALREKKWESPESSGGPGQYFRFLSELFPEEENRLGLGLLLWGSGSEELVYVLSQVAASGFCKDSSLKPGSAPYSKAALTAKSLVSHSDSLGGCAARRTRTASPHPRSDRHHSAELLSEASQVRPLSQDSTFPSNTQPSSLSPKPLCHSTKHHHKCQFCGMSYRESVHFPPQKLRPTTHLRVGMALRSQTPRGWLELQLSDLETLEGALNSGPQ